MTPVGRPSVLMAPMNMAMMPVLVVKELRRRGRHAAHIQFSFGQEHRFGFDMDRVVNLRDYPSATAGRFATLQGALEEGFDIFHFWNKSMYYHLDYSKLTGLDIPLIKARGRRVAYRFTGFDLRLPSWDLERNPHSPFKYGLKPIYNEDIVKGFIDFLGEYVDSFIVQDPEMAQFHPGATVIPRALDLTEWAFVGVKPTQRPLVVHAPSNDMAKGTPQILAAVEKLHAKKLDFDFRLIKDMAHADARALYAQADVIVDQILIGATGVLTLEAWALGKPVVVNLRRDLFEPFYGEPDLPVVNANPDTIEAALEQVIVDFDLRQDLAVRGRALVERRHDLSNVVDQYVAHYDAMMAAEPKRPTGYGDIAYLSAQLENAGRHEARARNQAALVNEVRRENRLLKRRLAKLREAMATGEAAPAQRDGKTALETPPGWVDLDDATEDLHQLADEMADASADERRKIGMRTIARSLSFADFCQRRLVASGAPIVQCHDTWSLWAGYRVARQTDAALIADLVEIPVLAERSGHQIREIPAEIQAFMERRDERVIAWADKLWTVSSPLKHFIEGRYFVEADLMRNFRSIEDRAKPTDLKAQLGLGPDDRLLAYVNTMDHDLGIMEAIGALRHLPSNYSLFCIGRFPNDAVRREVEAQIARHGLQARVVIRPPAPPAAFLRLLASCDVGLHLVKPTSENLRMSLSNRIGDCISAGTPILSTEIEEPARIVREHGIGEVIERLDAEAVAAAAQRLAAPERRAGLQQKLAAAAAALSWEAESQDYLAYIEGELARRATATAPGYDVAILARKGIEFNGRIFRQAKTLGDAGLKVIVIAYSNFDPSLRDLIPTVEVVAAPRRLVLE